MRLIAICEISIAQHITLQVLLAEIGAQQIVLTSVSHSKLQESLGIKVMTLRSALQIPLLQARLSSRPNCKLPLLPCKRSNESHKSHARD